MSLNELFKLIKKRLLLIITLTLVTTSIAIVLSFYILTPTYQAQTQILVNQKDGNQETLGYQMETDLQLISTYNVIFKSTMILTQVIEKLDLNFTPEQLEKKITISNVAESTVVNITVIDNEHQQAVKIANTLVEIVQDEIPSLINVDNINVLSEAKNVENPSPIKPNKVLNIAVGTVLGIILGIGVTFLIEILDTTIKDENDVEEILHIPMMGVVGSIPEEKVKKTSIKPPEVRSSQNAWIEEK